MRAISPGTLARLDDQRFGVLRGAEDGQRDPIRLLRLAAGGVDAIPRPNAGGSSPWVLVLPLDPVIATTGVPSGNMRRRARASRPSAVRVSSTSRRAIPRPGACRGDDGRRRPSRFGFVEKVVGVELCRL